MGEITTIGLDLAKQVFQVHGVDADGATVLRKQLRRAQVLVFFGKLPRCLVGMEACATAHYWARELRALGHEVRLMPAQYVKAYVKRNKNDAADAEAICEAVVGRRCASSRSRRRAASSSTAAPRPRAAGSPANNAGECFARASGGVRRDRAAGLRNVGRLIAIVRDEEDARLPDLARQVLQVLAVQIEQLRQRLRRWRSN